MSNGHLNEAARKAYYNSQFHAQDQLIKRYVKNAYFRGLITGVISGLIWTIILILTFI